MKQKAPALLALFEWIKLSALGYRNVNGLQASRALLNGEFNLLAFIQCFEALRLNGGVMHEYIIAAFTLDKAVALRGIEPLHSTFFTNSHNFPSFTKC
mgnify:CR=1 FL=1